MAATIRVGIVGATVTPGGSGWDHALTRHRLLDAIERSSLEGRAIDLND